MIINYKDKRHDIISSMVYATESVSIILPCLNEEETIVACISAAKKGLAKLKEKGVLGEIIVVDNGSTDHSATLAKRAGAKVVFEKEKGYGVALRRGIRASKGEYIVIGDSDGTYDFGKIPLFIKSLEDGANLVLGSRFKGKIGKKSMPFFNRYLGNPILTGLINLFYGCSISDTQTGFRAFTRQAYRKMQLKSSGMDFASEMIFKTISYKLKVAEIPIDYHPRGGVSKLSPIKDAWKHFTAILIYSPTYAFIIPGTSIFLFGTILTALLLPGPMKIGGRLIDIHTMIVAILLSSIGIHIMLIGFFARLYTVKKLGIKGGMLSYFLIKYVSLEKLFGFGITLLTIATLIIGIAAFYWITSGFSALAKEREFIAAAGLAMIGAQLSFSSFLFGMLQRDT